MIRLSSLFASWALLAGVSVGAPKGFENVITERQSSVDLKEGTHDGFYYQILATSGTNMTYTNREKGSYSVEWNGGGDYHAGKGWKPGNSG